LSPEHRAVLVMKDLEGQKYEGMAEILGVPIGTIRSRLHRARMELRELLLQEEAPAPSPHAKKGRGEGDIQEKTS
jgi:RNA polymerase sigma-70 factor (ECF subfamily)